MTVKSVEGTYFADDDTIMNLFNELLFCISPLLAIFYLYVVFGNAHSSREVYWDEALNLRKRNPILNKLWFESQNIEIALTIVFIYLMCINILKCDLKKVSFEVHATNIVSIKLVASLLFGVRYWLESKEAKLYGRTRKQTLERGAATFNDGLIDLRRNLIIFLVCYTSSFKINNWYVAAGIIFATFSMARIIYFRVYKDIYVHKMYRPNSERHIVPNKEGRDDEGHVFLRGILDMLPRAYLYTAFSFTIFQLLILNEPLYGSTRVMNDAYVIDHSSGNPFVDFFFFTLIPGGFGDIIPRSALAKTISSLPAIINFILVSSIAASFGGRFLSVAQSVPDRLNKGDFNE